MTYDEFVNYLDHAGVALCLREGEIEIEAADEVLTAEVRALARKYRNRLVNELKRENNGGNTAEGRARADRGTPLSWFQERLWFLHARSPESLSYNIPILLALEGPLNVAALQSSLCTIVERHESLRTVYRVASDGTPHSYVTNCQAFELSLLDVSEDVIPAHVAEVVKHRFDLAAGPVFIGRLLRVSASKHVLLLNVHHIAADGWSMQGVFLRELVECYQAASSGRPPELRPLATQYRDFARWQREADVTDGLQYFLASLEGYQDTLELPSDHLRHPESGKQSANLVYRYSAEFARKLTKFSRAHGVTVFMALFGALALAVSRHSGRDDVCLGTTSSGRHRVDLEPLIGFFINILPLRLQVDEDVSVAAFMEQVRARALGAFEHQMVPFEQIVRAGGYARQLKANPLVPVIVRHQNFPRTSLRAPLDGGLIIGPYTGAGAAPAPADDLEARGGISARCELELSYVGTGDELEVELVYAADLYEKATIERLLSHHEHLLEQMFAAPSATLASLELLRPADAQGLPALHDGADQGLADERPFSRRFTELSRQAPDAECCEDSEAVWSYARVETRSNQLAHCLLAEGVRPGDVVGVCLKRGAQALVALLAIWKAGAAYVPLDPAYPEGYLRQILDDAAPVTIVTTTLLQERLGFRDAQCFAIDQRMALLDAKSSLPPAQEPELAALAYVMYTSGSTGVPKGVRVPHRQLNNWLGGIQARWPFQAGEVIAQKTTLAFAVSVKELFAGLLNGCRLVFLDDDTVKDSPRLCEALQKQRISRLNLVPSHLKALVEHVKAHAARLPDLRILITAGEPLTADVVKACRAELPHVRLLNNYGCTELNDITYYEVSDYSGDQGFVPIGKPIQNTRLYVLDRRGRLVPEGVAGELHVATLGMSDGYHGRPDLTEERYLPNRFGDPSQSATAPQRRLYNTGDVVRRLPDGNLDYIGRWDLQLKVRGFRVDVRHVEKVLGDYPGIGQRAVAGEGERLVAFYVLQPEKQVELAALRDFLRARLPSYLVPDAFVLLEDLPRLPNGKLNRRALAVSERELQQSDAYVAVETDTERALAKIWADVLEVPVEAIGRYSHFFEVGGHSLAATRIVARVADAFRVELPLSVIFEKPLLSALAEHVAAVRLDHETLPRAPEKGSVRKKSPAPKRWSLTLEPAESMPVQTAQLFENRLLENKVALVTGASRGIGEAIALLLARSGARVAINFRESERRAGELKAQIEAEGGTAIAVQADVTQADEVRRLAAEVRRRLGPIDVLVANASIGFKKRAFVDYDFSDLEHKVSSELKAVFYPCQAVVPDMLERQGGSIIAISSTLSKHGSGGFAAQSSAKAALDAFVRSLAVELGPEGIRVNTVAPGVTLTDAAANMPHAHKAATAAQTPLGRNGTPGDMAGTVLFLASDLSRFMTGCYLPVDGGITML